MTHTNQNLSIKYVKRNAPQGIVTNSRNNVERVYMSKLVPRWMVLAYNNKATNDIKIKRHFNFEVFFILFYNNFFFFC